MQPIFCNRTDRAVMPNSTRLATGEVTASAGQRRVIGHRQLQPEQAKHAGAERLGLTEGQMEHQPQRQHQLNRQVGVEPLAA